MSHSEADFADCGRRNLTLPVIVISYEGGGVISINLNIFDIIVRWEREPSDICSELEELLVLFRLHLAVHGCCPDEAIVALPKFKPKPVSDVCLVTDIR